MLANFNVCLYKPLGELIPMARNFFPTDKTADTVEMLTTEEITALPKIELHNHLEGMIRISTIVDLCEKFGERVPGVDPANPEDLKPYLVHFTNHEKVQEIDVFFDKFWQIQSLLRTEEVLERLAFEACEDSFNIGIKLVEFRYSPSFIATSKYSDHSHLTLESIHNAILAGIARARGIYDIAVGLIGILDRSIDLAEEMKVFNFIIDHADDFVGLDIANDEKNSCVPFAPLYARAKEVGLGLTCHAGESTDASSVRDAVEQLNVTRIGHGYRSIEDPELLTILKDRNIVLEICPISNVLTGSVESIEAHPVRRLLDAGISLCVNSDDAGMFDSTLVDDYKLLVEYHHFTAEELRQCNLVALNASFLPAAVKESVRAKYFA